MKANRSMAVAACAIGLLLAVPSHRADEADAAVVHSTRDTLARWVETQEIISKEQQNWQLGREVLERRIALLESEIASFDDRIAETRKGIGEVDSTRSELDDEAAGLTVAASMLAERIPELEAKTRRLAQNLPDPVREKLSPLIRRLPEDPAGTELTLGQRFQNVIGILNEVNKFQRNITVTSEIRPLADGSTAEVRALYIGLGQAYYVTADGKAAGTGLPTDEGWKWTPRNELAGKVAQAIAVFQNEDVPAYVPLPVEIR